MDHEDIVQANVPLQEDFMQITTISTVHTTGLGARRWLVLGIVSVALLLIVIDMTVLYTALPRQR